MSERNKKIDEAICCLVDCGAKFIDALDPQLRALAAKGLFSVAMWVCRLAECCKPEPCPPLCPPPDLTIAKK